MQEKISTIDEQFKERIPELRSLFEGYEKSKKKLSKMQKNLVNIKELNVIILFKELMTSSGGILMGIIIISILVGIIESFITKGILFRQILVYGYILIMHFTNPHIYLFINGFKTESFEEFCNMMNEKDNKINKLCTIEGYKIDVFQYSQLFKKDIYQVLKDYENNTINADEISSSISKKIKDDQAVARAKEVAWEKKREMMNENLNVFNNMSESERKYFDSLNAREQDAYLERARHLNDSKKKTTTTTSQINNVNNVINEKVNALVKNNNAIISEIQHTLQYHNIKFNSYDGEKFLYELDIVSRNSKRANSINSILHIINHHSSYNGRHFYDAADDNKNKSLTLKDLELENKQYQELSYLVRHLENR